MISTTERLKYENLFSFNYLNALTKSLFCLFRTQKFPASIQDELKNEFYRGKYIKMKALSGNRHPSKRSIFKFLINKYEKKMKQILRAWNDETKKK